MEKIIFPDSFEGGLRPSMEKLQWLSDRTEAGMFDRAAFKLVSFFDGAKNLQLTYDRGDVDEEELAALLKHPDEVMSVVAWVFDPNHVLTPRLTQAMKVLKPLLKNWKKPTLYRGFRPKAGQDHMGLKLAGYQGQTPGWLKAGDKFSYVSPNPLSFTYVPEVARAFGTIIVKINATKYYQRIFPLTETLMLAILKVGAGPTIDQTDKCKYFFTQAEHILMPGREPIEFEVVDVIRNKK